MYVMANDDLNYNECKSSDDHYWVSGGENMSAHCRRKPSQDD